jgi:hypothetical protein
LRNSITAGEPLTLKVIVLSDQSAKVTLYWRPLGAAIFKAFAGRHVARGVYTVGFPSEATQADLEYYFEASSGTGKRIRFPAAAPEICRTVVVIPDGR